ncbi:Crp/Fnr family transcriptional regulator [Sporolactobacillus vineae]|uniref:Crp/Fnr family transcriptional regulator n=1 Tax=Sporolactobacillus vineae TaxID=444463 RepID=UPI0002888DE4|nr:Crp/Fnr family transcriptional regulator [Sporolactobacillus vineae]
MQHCATLVPLFSHLEDRDLDKINNRIYDRTYHKGEQIIRPDGEPQLVIVAGGSMKVYQLSPSGREQLLRIIGPGSYEGEAALLGAENNNLFAESLQETKACILRRQDFVRLLQDDPQLSLKLLESNAAKIVSIEEQARLLMLGTVASRLATYLTNLNKTESGATFQLPLKMKELAGFLGTTAETLSRTFRQLEEQGLIQRKWRRITICEPQKLEEMTRL